MAINRRINADSNRTVRIFEEVRDPVDDRLNSILKRTECWLCAVKIDNNAPRRKVRVL
jgi:hypothetical protein